MRAYLRPNARITRSKASGAVLGSPLQSLDNEPGKGGAPQFDGFQPQPITSRTRPLTDTETAAEGGVIAGVTVGAAVHGRLQRKANLQRMTLPPPWFRVSDCRFLGAGLQPRISDCSIDFTAHRICRRGHPPRDPHQHTLRRGD